MNERPALPLSDRVTAGRALARALACRPAPAREAQDAALSGPRVDPRRDLVVLALPRGGVPVAAEIARRLGAALDVLVVRKLGHPLQPEFAMGAIASGGVEIRNEPVAAGVTPDAYERVLEQERAELGRRERAYRGGRPPVPLAGRHVVLVDDGLATGATMRAAVVAVQRRSAARVTVAVPIASSDALEQLAPQVDDVVCLASPEPFYALGRWYVHFPQLSDREVCAILEAAGPGADTG